MTTNNTFNIARFGLLCRQNLIHSYKLLITSLVAFCAGLFMLLLIIQIMEGFKALPSRRFIGVFIFIFFTAGIIWAGTSFPALRSKEKTLTYLMSPASVFEKFAMELLGRILLFILIVPLLYLAVYTLERSLVKMFYPYVTYVAELRFYKETAIPDFGYPHLVGWSYTLIASLMMLLFVIPFTGATIFGKNPVVKTLFALAIIFFFNLFVVYFFVSILEFRKYSAGSIWFIKDGENALVAAALAAVIFNLGLIITSYFKLKEKEV